MPAEIIVSAFCADYWSTFEVTSATNPNDTHTVTFDGGEGRPHCTCKAYFYAPEDDKNCKHIEFVFRHGCFWNPQWYEGGDCTLKPVRRPKGMIPHQRCPKCRRGMMAVRIAV